MAGESEQNFNRSGLTVCRDRACYTGQGAQKIPAGLLGVVGIYCTSLDLSFNELTSISGVKGFSNLQELILDNNELRDLRTLPNLSTITTLSINNNKIADMDSALERIQRCCPRVSYVSLLGNPGCPDQLTAPGASDEDDYERFRLYAIHVLPKTLRFLDSRSVSNEERSEAQRRGRFLKTVRPRTSSSEVNVQALPLSNQEFDEAHFYVNYTPLPVDLRKPHDHKGAYGKSRYRYSGKNSEGNRFISNSDL